MNQSEAQTLVTYLNRAGMLQALEGQAPVWADALDDVAFRDAQDAARALAKTGTRWVTPGDIRTGVVMIRNERIRVADPIAPPECIDPADTATERAWRRELNAGQGAGMTTEHADLAACRSLRITRRDQIEAAGDVAAAVKEITAAMPRIPSKWSA